MNQATLCLDCDAIVVCPADWTACPFCDLSFDEPAPEPEPEERPERCLATFELFAEAA